MISCSRGQCCYCVSSPVDEEEHLFDVFSRLKPSTITRSVFVAAALLLASSLAFTQGTNVLLQNNTNLSQIAFEATESADALAVIEVGNVRKHDPGCIGWSGSGHRRCAPVPQYPGWPKIPRRATTHGTTDVHPLGIVFRSTNTLAPYRFA